MEIRAVHDAELKRAIAGDVLLDLPEWFGIPEATEEYISNSASRLSSLLFVMTARPLAS